MYGHYRVLKIFFEIRDHLIHSAGSDDSDLTMNETEVFLNRAKKYIPQLKQIKTITVELQKKKFIRFPRAT